MSEAVRAFLVEKGVEEARLDAVGKGEDEAEQIADKGRRVEFHIISE